MGWFLPALVGGLAAGAAGGGVSFGLDKLFGGKKDSGGGSINVEDTYPSWTRNTANNLYPWLAEALSKYKPGEAYGGQLTAGMTPFETSGLDILSKYMNTPDTGDLFGAGKQQIMDTLGGRFANPETSPFIQAMTKMSNVNLEDAINTSRLGQGARGKFFSTAGLGEERRLTSDTQNYLNSIIGNFVQNERNKMFEAVPIANQMDEYANVLAPLKKISASQSLGSLQRTFEQADLERQYADFQRQRNEGQSAISSAGGLLMSGQPGGGATLNAPNTSNSFLTELLGKLAGNVNWGDLLKGGFGGRIPAGSTGYGGGSWGSSTPYSPYASTFMGNVPVAPAGYAGYN